MVRSVGAVLAGFAVMAGVVIVTTVLATKLLVGQSPPGHRPPTRHLVVNLLCGLLAAMLGGFVCAWIAVSDLLAHVTALAVFVVLLAVVSARSGQSGTPGMASWYPYGIAGIGVVGVLLGGAIRASVS